jgi:acyl carrier protein
LILASAPFLWYSIGIYHIYKGAITMSEQEILSAVQDIFRDNFDDDSLEINRSTCADDIEDWDSLEQINLLTAIEKKFNIKFKLADVRGLKDVGDLLDLVARMV